ncbi:MAG: hypothetical protein GC151_00755 [Betaproteobacteria bacterium]|nr:hypothetical protein [Betaproteobacteria bacterium]
MMTRQVAAAVNHMLAQAQWARDTLHPFSGKVVRVEMAPATVRLAITATGEVTAAGTETETALTVRLSPLTAARLAGGDLSARSDVDTEGDDALARAVWHVASNLRWDAEEDLSRLVGDIAAHRIAGAARSAKAAGSDALARTGVAIAEYVTEEAHLSPPAAELEDFLHRVDELRDDVDRLESRIARLERGAGGQADDGQ